MRAQEFLINRIRDIYPRRQQQQLSERNLTAAEFKKYDYKYLDQLIALASANNGQGLLEIDPSNRSTYGDWASITPDSLEQLKHARVTGVFPSRIEIQPKDQDEPVTAPLGVFFKSKFFTSDKKEYNTGHLAELFMGFCVSAKFFNLGRDVTQQQIMDMISHVDHSIDGNNYVFRLDRTIKYPRATGDKLPAKNDALTFLARVPPRSAQAFLEQIASTNRLSSDLSAVMASAIKYCNEAKSIEAACTKVRQDKNSNTINITSDGILGGSQGTKADLMLSIDGKTVNLLSLKTSSSDTLGQMSGLKFDTLKKWFQTGFNIDITPWQSKFDPSLTADTAYTNLMELYDTVVYPRFEKMIEDQSPGVEAEIVQYLANAALVFARGDSLEDIDVVKLDDTISTGNYKILRFSNNLVDAMRHLDLEAKLIGRGGRTIQILVKPAAGVKGKPNKLCQFRSQKMGKYYRNYFESGPMLEELTDVTIPTDSSNNTSVRAKSISATHPAAASAPRKTRSAT